MNHWLSTSLQHTSKYISHQFLAGFLPHLKMAKRLSATHHARWIGACLYILKMLICNKHFTLGPKQQIDVLMFSFYMVYIHFFWMSCTRMADTPFLTLSLYKPLEDWLARNLKGAKAAQKKVDLLTDYLTGRSVILALASEKVSEEMKEAMAAALKTHDPQAHVEMGKPTMPGIDEDSRLEDFVTEESWLFFQVIQYCSLEP